MLSRHSPGRRPRCHRSTAPPAGAGAVGGSELDTVDLELRVARGSTRSSRARPSSSEVVASQPSSSRASDGIGLGAPAPRWRRGAAGASSTGTAAPRERGQASANRSRDRLRCDPCRAGSSGPPCPAVTAARTKPSTVSATKVRSRRGSSRPSRISRPPGEQLADHRRQDRALRLARPERVERAQHDDRDARRSAGRRCAAGRPRPWSRRTATAR